MNPLDLINNSISFDPECFYDDVEDPNAQQIPSVAALPGHEEPLTKKQCNAIKDVLEAEREIPPKNIRQENPFPTLKYTLEELRQFLIKKSPAIRETGYIAGGTALNILTDGKHPKNDLDISWYVGENFGDEKTFKSYIYEFFETKLEPEKTFETPEARVAFFQEFYFIPPTDTSTFTLFQLPNLDIKFCRSELDENSSVAAEDGFQVSLTNSTARCLNRGKWLNKNEFEIVRKNVDLLIYNVEKNDWPKIRHLLFRLLFKMTQGYQITCKSEIFQSAFEKMIKEAPWQETDNYLKLRKTFLKHQFNHYPSHESGRMIDLLNAISQGVLGIKDQTDKKTYVSALSKAWHQAQPRILTDFSKILSKKPEMAPKLLNIVRGIFLIEWMRKTPDISASLRMQFCLTEGGRKHFLSLEESHDPAAIAIDFITSWQEVEKELKGTNLYSAFTNMAKGMGFSKLSLTQENRQQVIRELIGIYNLKHVKKVIDHLPTSSAPSAYFEALFQAAKNEDDLSQIDDILTTLDEQLKTSSRYLSIVESLIGKCTNTDQSLRIGKFLKTSLIKCVKEKASREATIKLLDEYIVFTLTENDDNRTTEAFEIAESLLLLSKIPLDPLLHGTLLRLGEAMTEVDEEVRTRFKKFSRSLRFLKRLSNACPLNKKLQHRIQEICISKIIEALENHAYQPFIQALENLIQTNTLPKMAQEKFILLKQSALAEFQSKLDGYQIDFVEAMMYFNSDMAIEIMKKFCLQGMPLTAVDTIFSRILHAAFKQPELMPMAYKFNEALLSGRPKDEPMSVNSLYLQILSQYEASQKIEIKLLQHHPKESLMKLVDLTITSDNYPLYHALLEALNPIIPDKADLLLDLLSKITLNTSLANKFEPLTYLFSRFLDAAGLEKEENAKAFKEKFKKFLFEKMNKVDACKIMLMNCLSLSQHDAARGVFFTKTVLEGCSELSTNPMPNLTALLADEPKNATRLLKILKGLLYLITSRQQLKTNKDNGISPMQLEIEIGGIIYSLIRSPKDLPNQIFTDFVESWFALEKELSEKPALKNLYYLANDLDPKLNISLSTDYRLTVLKELINIFETPILSHLDFGTNPEQSPKLFFEWLSKFAGNSLTFDTKFDLNKRIEEAQLDIMIRQKQIQNPVANVDEEPEIKTEALLISIIEKIRACMKADADNKLDLLLAELNKLTSNHDLSALLTKQAELKQMVAQVILKTLHKELSSKLNLKQIQNAYRLLELSDSLQFFTEAENTESLSLVISAYSKILPSHDPETVLFMLEVLSDVHRWGPPTTTIQAALKELQPNLLNQMLPIAFKLMEKESSPAHAELVQRCLLFASKNSAIEKTEFLKIVKSYFKVALIQKTGSYLRLAGTLATKILEDKAAEIDPSLQNQIFALGKSLVQIRQDELDENKRLEQYRLLGENLLVALANELNSAELTKEILEILLKRAASLLVASQFSSRDTEVILNAFHQCIDGCVAINELSIPLKEKLESLKQFTSDNLSVQFKEAVKAFIQAAALVDPFLAGDILSETTIYNKLSSEIRDKILLSIINTFSSKNQIPGALKAWSLMKSASLNSLAPVHMPQAKIEATLNLLTALTVSNRPKLKEEIQRTIEYISFVCKREEDKVIHSTAAMRTALDKAFRKASDSLIAMNSPFGTLTAETLSALAAKYQFTLTDADQISFEAVRLYTKDGKLPTAEMIDGFQQYVILGQSERIKSQELIEVTLKLVQLCQKSPDNYFQTISISLLVQLLQSKFWPQEPSADIYALLNKIIACLDKDHCKEKDISQVIELTIEKKCFNSLDLPAANHLLKTLIQNNLLAFTPQIWEKTSILQPNEQEKLFQILCESNKFGFIQFAFNIFRSTKYDSKYCNILLNACVESTVFTLFPLIEEHVIKSNALNPDRSSPETLAESYKSLFAYILKIAQNDRQHPEKMLAYASCLEKVLPKALALSLPNNLDYKTRLETSFVECCLLTNQVEFLHKAFEKILENPKIYSYETIFQMFHHIIIKSSTLRSDKSKVSQILYILRDKQQKGDCYHVINYVKQHLEKIVEKKDSYFIDTLLVIFFMTLNKSTVLGEVETAKEYEKQLNKLAFLFSQLGDHGNLKEIDRRLQTGENFIKFETYVKNIKKYLLRYWESVEKLTEDSNTEIVTKLVKTTTHLLPLLKIYDYRLGLKIIGKTIPYLKKNPQELIPSIFSLVDSFPLRDLQSDDIQAIEDISKKIDLEVLLIDTLVKCFDLSTTNLVLDRLNSLISRYIVSPVEKEYAFAQLFESFNSVFSQILIDRAANPNTTTPDRFKIVLTLSLNMLDSGVLCSEFFHYFLQKTIQLLTFYPELHKDTLLMIEKELPVVKYPSLLQKVRYFLNSKSLKHSLHVYVQADNVCRDLLDAGISFLPFFKTNQELDNSKQDQFRNWAFTYIIEILECAMTSEKFITVFKTLGARPGFYTSKEWEGLSRVLSFVFSSLNNSKLDNKIKIPLLGRFAKVLGLNPAIKTGWEQNKKGLINLHLEYLQKQIAHQQAALELVNKIAKETDELN